LAAAAVVSALVAVAPREPVVPVAAQRLDPVPLPQQPEFPAPSPPVLGLVPMPAQLLVVVGLARLPVAVPLVLAHLAVEPAVAVEPLLSLQSFSAAMARSSP
jgi:hypothetical protein